MEASVNISGLNLHDFNCRDLFDENRKIFLSAILENFHIALNNFMINSRKR